MVIVWNVATASVAAAYSCEHPVLSLDWEPNGNALVCMLQSGDLDIWNDVITEGQQPLPCEDVPKRIDTDIVAEPSSASPKAQEPAKSSLINGD